MMSRRGHTHARRLLTPAPSPRVLCIHYPFIPTRQYSNSPQPQPNPAGTAVSDPSSSTVRQYTSTSYTTASAALPSISPWKGKQRADPAWTQAGPEYILTRHYGTHQLSPIHLPRRQHIRHFHATARRDAIPLVPAAIGIFKSASVLTAVTAISRVLISFFPLSTIAAFRMVRGVKWLSADAQKPDASPEAEEFWKMWCEGEKGKHPTWDQAKDLLDGTKSADGGITGSDGRTAYCVPMPPGHSGRGGKKWITNITDEPRVSEHGRDRTRWLVQTMKRTRFYLPDLPSAAVSYYEGLSRAHRGEVDELRRYYLSLQMFKEGLRSSRWVMSVVLFLPMLLLTGVYLCGLERVPLTGRWRLILLTPEEEDTISTSLAGANWYRSVINLLTTPEHPAPPVVPYEDWRWRWVQGVLRRLETAILAECHGLEPPYGAPLLPVPPSHYPLKPRPRVSSLLHSALPGGEPYSGKEHLDIGPPYSLMILEKEEQNAFSYGFGGKGAGGIVIYTGLLDKILREVTPGETLPQAPAPNPSGLSGLLASIFSTSPRSAPIPQPTEAQTLHLACVLSHEIGHLLLSHHLETLSQQQVLWPSILGLSMDLLRAFIWPLTFFLGPTVNDALASVGRTSADEMAERYGQIGFQWKHEYEADLAGLRTMALAGFDPTKAVNHFSLSVAELHEIQQVDGENDSSITGKMFKLWTQATHPSVEQRTASIQKELRRWETEAELARKE